MSSLPHNMDLQKQKNIEEKIFLKENRQKALRIEAREEFLY